MKAVVISDSHGYANNIHAVLEREKECKTVIFLGDGISDVLKVKEWFPNHSFICVKGNNDFHSDENTTAYKCFEKCVVVMSHGHLFSVRQSRRELINHAKGVMANAVFYGHTHKAEDYTDVLSGIRVVNPGALCDGKYAVAEFNKGEVEVNLLRL